MPSGGQRRPPELRRSWLFIGGADEAQLAAGPESGADVLIQELEDFTAPERRPFARGLASELYSAWRTAGAVAAVRVNPLAGDGRADLEAAMAGAPDCVLLPKVEGPEQASWRRATAWRRARRSWCPMSRARAACASLTRSRAPARGSSAA